MANDFFLGNMLETGGRTTWVNKTSFRLCPCANSNSSDANCDGRNSFQGGVWRTPSDDDLCLHPQETKWTGNDLTLFDDSQNLSFIFLNAPDIHESSNSESIHPNRVILPTETSSDKTKDSSSLWSKGVLIGVVNFVIDFLVKWSWLPAYFSFFFILKSLKFSKQNVN